MRIDPVYREYMEKKCEYNTNGQEIPVVMENTYQAKMFLDAVLQVLRKIADGGAISKKDSLFFDSVCEKHVPCDTPMEIKTMMECAIEEISNLRVELKNNINEFFVDGYTLTKGGKKRIRKAHDRIKNLRFEK